MLQAFKSLPVARAMSSRRRPARAARATRATPSRSAGKSGCSARGRRRSDGGVEFGTALTRGTVLRGGDCFVLEQPAIVVAVVERPEPVFVIVPRTPAEWALFAYHIGNCHQPVMVTDEAIVCADVPGMKEVLDYHRIPFTRADPAVHAGR